MKKNNALIVRCSGPEKLRYKHFLGLGADADTIMVATKPKYAQNSMFLAKQNNFSFFSDHCVARSEVVYSLTGFISVFSGIQI